ncbi:hypothetical protein [Deinococcus aquiradiocola]|uniref:Uncharacterized protein n=1 Tax=Deinococcus aquiradiocola TaxID=393059 RepID=A0A917PPS4_9DEIO|nr:hypothetical protein [Deinococcus aquiradiocola]GGJ86340.1 hypothetical protein GCM10008939_32810 [Deinococcus aquiradiocola]
MGIEYSAKSPNLIVYLSFNLPLPNQVLTIKNNNVIISKITNPEYGADYKGILLLENTLGKNKLTFHTNYSNADKLISEVDKSDISVAFNELRFADISRENKHTIINLFKVSFLKNYEAAYTDRIYFSYGDDHRPNNSVNYLIITNDASPSINFTEYTEDYKKDTGSLLSHNHFVSGMLDLAPSQKTGLVQIKYLQNKSNFDGKKISEIKSLTFLKASVSFQPLSGKYVIFISGFFILIILICLLRFLNIISTPYNKKLEE